jgi:hypothetical protein
MRGGRESLRLHLDQTYLACWSCKVYERCSEFPTCVDACDCKARGREATGVSREGCSLRFLACMRWERWYPAKPILSYLKQETSKSGF